MGASASTTKLYLAKSIDNAVVERKKSPNDCVNSAPTKFTAKPIFVVLSSLYISFVL